MRLARLFGRRKGLSEFGDFFVRNHLAAVLDEIGLPNVVRIGHFATGQNALIRRLDLSDGRSLVLRAYLADPEKQSGQCHWHLTRHLVERGVRVATVRFRRTFSFPRGKANVEVLLEDYIEGAVLSDAMCDDAALRRKIADLLLLLHRDHSVHPGRPWLQQVLADPLHEGADKAPGRLERVRKVLSEAAPARIEACLRWFRAAVSQRPAPASYELTHRDWNRENLLLTPAGGLALVDLVSMAYGCFENDLVGARMMFFDQAWWRAFCADYFAQAPERRERFERNAPVFFADFFLIKASRQASSAVKALEKGERGVAEAHRAKSRRFWEMLLAVVEGGAPWSCDAAEIAE